MDKELSDKQLLAIDSLLSGKGRAEAAASAGVDRVTLWRWLTDDVNFAAKLNRARQDIHSANTERLRSMGGQAVDVLETLLNSENENVRLKAAMSILKAVSLAAMPKPSGETDPGKLAEDREARQAIDDLIRRF